MKEQPSSESLRELVKDGILTKDEAREILFSSQEEQDRDKDSLQAEIKFLRELVEKLSNNRSHIVEIIKEIDRPVYIRSPWYRPYEIWCGSSINTYAVNSGTTATVGIGTSGGLTGTALNTASTFSDIKTF